VDRDRQSTFVEDTVSNKQTAMDVKGQSDDGYIWARVIEAFGGGQSLVKQSYSSWFAHTPVRSTWILSM